MFQITGTLTGSTPGIDATVRFSSSQLGGTLLFATGTPTTPPIDTIIVPDPVTFSGSREFDFRLSANIASTGTAFPAGDHTAVADFTSTLSLLGFALFEDADGTRPILDGVIITGASGNQIALVDLSNLNPIPLPASFWLFGTALIGFIGYARRRHIS